MNTTTFRRLAVLASVTVLVGAAGCSTKADDDAGSGSGDVKTGRGVSGTTITVGSLTDLTGPFAALGTDFTNAQALYWQELNKGDKVCGTYTVKEKVKDYGYDVQKGVQLYSSIREDVLAMEQTIGSPLNASLSQQFDADKMVNIPGAWAQALTEDPQNALVGATYEVEMINALNYVLDEGLISDGGTLGHIYFEGEYGEGGLGGSKYFADKHDMKLVEVQIQPTDTDMTAAVTKLAAEGVDAIAITTGPTQTASIAGVAAAAGLNVPLVGNNPTYFPGLLDTPAGPALLANMYVASPVNTFDAAPSLLKSYQKKFDKVPTIGAVFGYASADVMRQILDKACEDGDLTPEGVTAAKDSMGTVTTGGLAVPVKFAVGKSSSDSVFILRPADVPGGAKAATKLYTSKDATAFIKD